MKYSVRPFSGKRWKTGIIPDNACAICGKPVAVPWQHVAIVIEGGSEWGDETSPKDGGWMGCFPVGPDCHRRHVIH